MRLCLTHLMISTENLTNHWPSCRKRVHVVAAEKVVGYFVPSCFELFISNFQPLIFLQKASPSKREQDTHDVYPAFGANFHERFPSLTQGSYFRNDDDDVMLNCPWRLGSVRRGG